jgi:hypothetical protein
MKMIVFCHSTPTGFSSRLNGKVDIKMNWTAGKPKDLVSNQVKQLITKFKNVRCSNVDRMHINTSHLCQEFHWTKIRCLRAYGKCSIVWQTFHMNQEIFFNWQFVKWFLYSDCDHCQWCDVQSNHAIPDIADWRFSDRKIEYGNLCDLYRRKMKVSSLCRFSDSTIHCVLQSKSIIQWFAITVNPSLLSKQWWLY